METDRRFRTVAYFGVQTFATGNLHQLVSPCSTALVRRIRAVLASALRCCLAMLERIQRGKAKVP